MSDSQAHNPQAFFTNLFAESIGRVEGAAGEYAKLEGRTAEQAKQWIDESARLSRETLSYSMQLSEQWRKLALETVRRSLEMVTPRA